MKFEFWKPCIHHHEPDTLKPKNFTYGISSDINKCDFKIVCDKTC